MFCTFVLAMALFIAFVTLLAPLLNRYLNGMSTLCRRDCDLGLLHFILACGMILDVHLVLRLSLAACFNFEQQVVTVLPNLFYALPITG